MSDAKTETAEEKRIKERNKKFKEETEKAREGENNTIGGVRSQRVKKVFDEYMRQLMNGDNPSLYQIQKDFGYSDYSAKSYQIKNTKTWQYLLDQIDDNQYLDRLHDIAMNGKDTDSLRAIKMMLKMKGVDDANKKGGFNQKKYENKINQLVEHQNINISSDESKSSDDDIIEHE